MNILNVIHVDDEPRSLKAFEDVVLKNASVAYMGGFTDAQEANEYIMANNKVDVAILDIEMPGKDGFWLAERIRNSRVHIVFLTSHAQFALRAFEACAIDYLLKPITETALADLIGRYNVRKTKFNKLQVDQVSDLYANLLPSHIPRRIFVNTVGQIDIIQLDQVLYFLAKDNSTIIYMENGTKHTVGKRLKTYEDILQKNTDFVRIHRSFMVNKHFVVRIIRDSKKHRYAAVLSNGTELEISSQKSDEVIKNLE